MSSKLLKKFEGLAETMFEDMSTAAGEYLHDLHEEEDSEDEVKAVVKKFPSALSHLNEKGQFADSVSGMEHRIFSVCTIVGRGRSEVEGWWRRHAWRTTCH